MVVGGRYLFCVRTFYKVHNKMINHVLQWSVFVENKARCARRLQLQLSFGGGKGFGISARSCPGLCSNPNVSEDHRPVFQGLPVPSLVTEPQGGVCQVFSL